MSENRLGHEISPYLLQHQHNPVHWWAWGPATLSPKPSATGKPILLSVGYAACHWCHVMAHESFEDDATAGVMNELFVNIKVDREERPDIDAIYMGALHALGEQGGWPLTMFLDSEARPVWGGTYFRRGHRYGRPAFVDVLRRISTDLPRRARARSPRTPGLTDASAASAPGHDGTKSRSTGSCRTREPRDGAARRSGARRSQGARSFRRRAVFWPALARRHPLRPTTPRAPPSSTRSTTSARAASTITSAAASPATRSTSAGWSRTSRRCSTTTRC